MTSVYEKNNLLFNPVILEWARTYAGISIEEAAHKLKQKPQKIIDWEMAQSSPTVNQARTLAAIYGRPFVEFFLDEPPIMKEWPTIPDFRKYKNVYETSWNKELKQIQIWASVQRENALDLIDELGESPPEIPEALFTTLNNDVEESASNARKLLNFSIEDQIFLKKEDAIKLPTILRNKCEQIGILTLKNSSLSKYGARGMCIADFPLPVIVFCNEAPTAQAFTIAHELGHIAIKQSGIIAPITYNSDSTDAATEKWCDRYAAAFLMPKEIIQKVAGEQPSQPLKEISDDVLNEYSKKLKVSPHAILIRLIQLNYVIANFYWDYKKHQFEEEEKNYKSFGRAPYYGTRYKNSLGSLYTGLVIDAWTSGRITNDNAARYMGIKNLQHLYNIRKDMGVV